MATYQKEFEEAVSLPTLTLDAEIKEQTTNVSGVFFYNGSWYDYTSEANDDTPDDVVLAGQYDALYIGAGSKFNIIKFDVTTAGIGDYGIWRISYWDGTGWFDLRAADMAASDNCNSFKTAEFCQICFHEQDDWVANDVNGRTLFWIQIYISNGSVTTIPLARRIRLSLASVAHYETLTDTISLSDILVQDAGVDLSDGIILDDSVHAAVGANLDDTIILTDAVVADASKQLADGISLSDQLIVAARISGLTLADAIVLSDDLRLSAHIKLDDTIFLNDSLRAGNQIFLGDVIHLNDALRAGNQVFLGDTIHLNDDLALGAGINLEDDITLTDQIIILTPSILLEDTITLTDNIGNIIPGVSNVAVGETIKNWNQPIQWEKAVGSQPSSLSGITDSSKNTTFGQENPYTVLDSSAWDLSKVEIGYIAVTTSGFMGVVISIGSNTVTVQSWHKAGIERVYGATDLPEDGESVTIHYRLRAKRVLIRSKEGNSNTVYVEQDGRYMDIASGHPIVATQWKRNSEVEISAPRDRWLNLSRIWITSLTSQTAVVIVDGEIPHTRGE